MAKSKWTIQLLANIAQLVDITDDETCIDVNFLEQYVTLARFDHVEDTLLF